MPPGCARARVRVRIPRMYAPFYQVTSGTVKSRARSLSLTHIHARARAHTPLIRDYLRLTETEARKC